MDLPKPKSEILLSYRGEHGTRLARTLTLRHMSGAAWGALVEQVSRGGGNGEDDLRDVPGVAQIEFPTVDSVRVGITDEERRVPVMRWLRLYAERYE